MNVATRKPEMKSDILENAGYRFNLDRRLYVNRKEKKAFSLLFLENHSPEEIEQCILPATPNGGEWQFFFNDPPSPAVARQLVDLLE